MHFHHGPSTASEPIPSSPPIMTSPLPTHHMLSPTRTSRRKEKRNPSVTPRRFGRFFTPRSSLPTVGRSILGVLEEGDVNNRKLISPQSLFSEALGSDPIGPPSPSEGRNLGDQDGNKRKGAESSPQLIKRRRGLTDEMPPPQLNLPGLNSQGSRGGEMRTLDESRPSQENLGDKRKATLNLFFKASRNGSRAGQDKADVISTSFVTANNVASSVLEGYEPKPIRKFRNRGFESNLLDREHGFSSVAGKQYLAYPAADYRSETAAFHSRSIDVHQCTAFTGAGNTIPFSLASCHAASVTAIGDEQGFVRLFNTTVNEGQDDNKVDTHIAVHDNAIMDLAFSADDLRLATACGDRSGKIVDVVTQTVAVELGGGHWDSLRQVTFQPGQANDSVIATSDRAGRIQVWDLRCSSIPMNNFSHTEFGRLTERTTSLDYFPAKTINTIDNAHERRSQGGTASASVTALKWMAAGREHLLLSASEANACVKLWDTRYIKPRRQVEETPLATTTQPRGHAWRTYGITSIALSSDSARLYAVCKDSTVYAYSTAHLMLGHAPELTEGANKRKPAGVEGLGPMYGFKHDMLRAQSFYVKCSIRPSINGSSELLVVGSSDGCAVLFPTDERYLRSTLAQKSHILSDSSNQSFAGMSFSSTCSQMSTPSGSGGSASSSIPISRSGTALIRGHSREVTTLSWSYDGKLVTASDDYFVRQWQQDEGKARHLRQVGEFGGERHMAGWADVTPDWDLCCDE